EGVTLRSEIDRSGVINPQLAAEWFDQLCEGLKAAHEYGVIHRDLKPENMIISKNDKGKPVVKVLDFGLAKVSRNDLADPNTLTVKGAVLGTLGYMSPEQLMGEEADERSDIFAVGVLVVEALTGQRPFHGKTHTGLLKSILHDS